MVGYEQKTFKLEKSVEIEEIKEQYDIHRVNVIKGYEDFLMTKESFLYTSDFSWELKSY